MAVANGYGKIVTSGSIFSYDTGDTYNSYKGEPTTNTLINQTWSGDGSNQVFAPKGAEIITDISLTYNGYSTVLWTPGISYNCYLHGDDINSSDTSTVWTFSCYIKRSDGGTLRSSDNNLSVYLYFPNSDGAAVGTIQYMGNGWYRIWRTRTGSANYISLAGFTGFAPGYKYYLSGWQLEKNNHPTQVLPINTTRSTTQGLLPLISNQTLDLTNVSYNSNAQLTFDGTDDNIVTNVSKTMLGNNCTFAAVINSSGNASTYNMFLGQLLPYIGALNGNQIIFSDIIGGAQQTIYSGDGIETGQNHYVVCTRTYNVGTNQTTNRIYIDSVLKGEGTFSGAPGDYGDKINIGDGQTTNWYPFYGYVYNVTLYNRTLSENEIQQNYQQYKTRFNLA